MTYNSLTPTANATDCDPYMDALSWALEQGDIHNIAVSGPYGSGKSSVIKTFFKKNLAYKYITISLANFRGSREVSSNDNHVNKSIQIDAAEAKGRLEQQPLSSNQDADLEQQIERSIVQQLFYHEKDSAIPDSHFQKIKKQDGFELFCTGLFIILFLISIFYIACPVKFWNYLYIVHAPKTLMQILQLFALAIIAIGIYKVIVHIIKITIGLSVKHFHFKNAEVALEKKDDKSILNYYIDEIIYFFEATEHSVVILEDLDRFDNRNIFVKLREINYLINNCDKIEQKVTFIYAIKDEIFLDKDRTKFFDFIIPIIPVVNYSNSGEILKRELISRNDKAVDDADDKSIIHENVIEELSLFIDDLRLLYNIINEYKIYREILFICPKNTNDSISKEAKSEKILLNLHADRLLAIIIYKNLYPLDFTELSQGKGLLYSIISETKFSNIKTVIEDCNKEIAQKVKRLEEIETIDQPFSAQELRIIYLNKIVEKLNPNIVYFIINNQKRTISDCVADEVLFNYIISSKNKVEFRYLHPNYGSEYSDSRTLNFHAIEQDVHELTYQQRLDLLCNTESNKLKNEIKNLEHKIEEYKQYTIAELIQEDKLKVENKTKKNYPDRQIDYLKIVLREGLINENYWEYISVFYPESLTYEDRQFVVNVFVGNKNPYDYPLNIVENVFKKLTKENTKYLKHPSSLNFDLMDYIVTQATMAYSEPYMSQMSSNPNFVIHYMDRGKSMSDFVNLLCVYWPNFWRYVTTNLTTEQDKYLNYILKYALAENIVPIFKNNKSYLEEYADFLLVDTDIEKLKELIQELDLTFKDLNPETGIAELEYIYLQRYYQINIPMIRVLLSKRDSWNELAFNTQNYSYINEYHPEMADYIHNNLSTYISNVYLPLESQQIIQSPTLVELLNNENLTTDQKIRIIHKSDCRIENVSNLNEISLRNEICRQNKMDATWENIRTMMDVDEVAADACDVFLNIIDNAQCLASSEMQEDEAAPKEKDLGYKLMHRNAIKDDLYAILISCAEFKYEEFDTNKLSKQHMQILIEQKKVSANKTGYMFLKENYPTLHIYLLETNNIEFNNKYEDLEFDANDIQSIIQSALLDNSTKKTMINSISSLEILEENEEIIKKLVHWLLLDETLEGDAFKVEIMNLLSYQSCIEATIRKQLYIKFSNQITAVALFLDSLGNPYSDLVTGVSKISLPKEDKYLLDILKRKKYVRQCKFTPWNNKYHISRDWINIPK